MQIHELKILPEYFDLQLTNKKNWEIRINDRDYKVNDLLILREWDNDCKEYTGRVLIRKVVYILSQHELLKDNTIIMSTKSVKNQFL